MRDLHRILETALLGHMQTLYFLGLGEGKGGHPRVLGWQALRSGYLPANLGVL